jgi:26S proteasome regulatory subunit T3
VRKNRYVILPVDFEEAWKVGCLALFATCERVQNLMRAFFPSSHLIQQTVKRTDETHAFCALPSFYVTTYLTIFSDR